MVISGHRVKKQFAVFIVLESELIAYSKVKDIWNILELMRSTAPV